MSILWLVLCWEVARLSSFGVPLSEISLYMYIANLDFHGLSVALLTLPLLSESVYMSIFRGVFFTERYIYNIYTDGIYYHSLVFVFSPSARYPAPRLVILLPPSPSDCRGIQ